MALPNPFPQSRQRLHSCHFHLTSSHLIFSATSLQPRQQQTTILHPFMPSPHYPTFPPSSHPTHPAIPLSHHTAIPPPHSPLFPLFPLFTILLQLLWFWLSFTNEKKGKYMGWLSMLLNYLAREIFVWWGCNNCGLDLFKFVNFAHRSGKKREFGQFSGTSTVEVTTCVSNQIK